MGESGQNYENMEAEHINAMNRENQEVKAYMSAQEAVNIDKANPEKSKQGFESLQIAVIEYNKAL